MGYNAKTHKKCTFPKMGTKPLSDWSFFIVPIIDTLRSLFISIGESFAEMIPAYLNIDSDFLFTLDNSNEDHWVNKIDPGMNKIE